MVIVWSTHGDCSTEVHYRMSAFGNSDTVHGVSDRLPSNFDFSFIHKVKLIVSSDLLYLPKQAKSDKGLHCLPLLSKSF